MCVCHVASFCSFIHGVLQRDIMAMDQMERMLDQTIATVQTELEEYASNNDLRSELFFSRQDLLRECDASDEQGWLIQAPPNTVLGVLSGCRLFLSTHNDLHSLANNFFFSLCLCVLFRIF